MQKKYKGILLYLKVYKENDLLIKFLSNSDELISGIVYGGLSKNKRNIFQIGFYLNFEVSLKSNRPPSINAELAEPYMSNIINDKFKLNCLICVTSLINLSIIEGQKVKNLYAISDSFLLKMVFNKKWLNDFCIFLFNLLKIIGYEIDYSSQTKNQFFIMQNLKFTNVKSNNTIEFPHNILNNKSSNFNIHSINQIFNIFENVFTKYHLSNFNLRLPNQYQLFKKLIIETLQK